MINWNREECVERCRNIFYINISVIKPFFSSCRKCRMISSKVYIFNNHLFVYRRTVTDQMLTDIFSNSWKTIYTFYTFYIDFMQSTGSVKLFGEADLFKGSINRKYVPADQSNRLLSIISKQRGVGQKHKISKKGGNPMSFFEKAAFAAGAATTEVRPAIQPGIYDAVLENISEINAEYVLFTFRLGAAHDGTLVYKVFAANERGFMELTADCHALDLADASPLGVPELRSKLIGTRVKLEVSHARVDGSVFINPKILCVVTDGDGTRITEADVIEAMYSAV